MTSLKVKLRLEPLGDRITPAAYATVTDPSDWYGFDPATVVMDDRPASRPADSGEPLPGNGTAATFNAATTEFIATPAPMADGFKTVDEVKAELSKNPDAKAILDAFEKDGGKVQAVENSFSGAYYDPMNKTVGLDPKKTTDLNDATSALLYELLRYKYSKEQLELDKKAKDGTLTKEQYATECEKLTYKYMQEHHTIAEKGVKDGKWNGDVDSYKQNLKDFPTFDKYLEDAKKPANGHYGQFEKRYDDLRK